MTFELQRMTRAEWQKLDPSDLRTWADDAEAIDARVCLALERLEELEADLKAEAAKPEELPGIEELPAGCEIRRLELRPGDILVITSPRRVGDKALDAIRRFVEACGERQGITDLSALILENGMDLRAVLRPDAARKEV